MTMYPIVIKTFPPPHKLFFSFFFADLHDDDRTGVEGQRDSRRRHRDDLPTNQEHVPSYGWWFVSCLLLLLTFLHVSVSLKESYNWCVYGMCVAAEKETILEQGIQLLQWSCSGQQKN